MEKRYPKIELLRLCVKPQKLEQYKSWNKLFASKSMQLKFQVDQETGATEVFVKEGNSVIPLPAWANGYIENCRKNLADAKARMQLIEAVLSEGTTARPQTTENPDKLKKLREAASRSAMS